MDKKIGCESDFHYAKPTVSKALEINLNNKFYGSFAEIGGGQETSRYFFRAGAASQTVARTNSAYAKDFSDALYGSVNGRYVTEARLQKMLLCETNLIEDHICDESHKRKNFFSFANTVTTIDFAKRYKGHGWIGIRFEMGEKKGVYNEIRLHIRFKQTQVLLQQETLGILGVNLIYGAFYHYNDPKELLKQLYDNIEKDSLEIDVVDFSGPLFESVDNRLMCLFLLKNKMTNAVLFNPEGKPILAAEVFYKKNILGLRGRFRPVTLVHMDIYEKSYLTFLGQEGVDRDNMEVVFEITLSNLTQDNEYLDEKDFIDRASLLESLGHNVLISNFEEHYKAVAYFSNFTEEQIGISMGVMNLPQVFDPSYYEELKGGLMQGVGRLFQNNVQILLYPQKTDKAILNSKNFEFDDKWSQMLFKFYHDQGKFIDVEAEEKYLNIYSDEVLKMIQNNKPGWEKLLPGDVHSIIKSEKLFGCQ